MKKFEAGQPVLYRNSKAGLWHYGIYDQVDTELGYNRHNIIGCVGYLGDDDVLAYNEDTKTMIGKTGDYTKWEPQPGKLIGVRDFKDDQWVARRFIRKYENKFICSDESILEDEVDWVFAAPLKQCFDLED